MAWVASSNSASSSVIERRFPFSVLLLFILLFTPSFAKSSSDLSTTPRHERRDEKDLDCWGELPSHGWPPGRSPAEFANLRELCDILNVGCLCFNNGHIYCDQHFAQPELHLAFHSYCRVSCYCVDLDPWEYFNEDDKDGKTIATVSDAGYGLSGIERGYKPLLKKLSPQAMQDIITKYSEQCKHTTCSSWNGCPTDEGGCNYDCKSHPAAQRVSEPWLWKADCAISYGFRRKKRQMFVPPPKSALDLVSGPDSNLTSVTNATDGRLRVNRVLTEVEETVLLTEANPCPCNCTYVSRGCCDPNKRGIVHEAADKNLGLVLPPNRATCCDTGTGEMRWGGWGSRNGTCM
ncbi:MAG: hypothetical protein M1817_006379 [Caeruleum heppii]|nr:MAG: hypothetical protein M1817_006379 [Caeruleum heppii]